MVCMKSEMNRKSEDKPRKLLHFDVENVLKGSFIDYFFAS
jgi:hypothetical protein